MLLRHPGSTPGRKPSGDPAGARDSSRTTTARSAGREAFCAPVLVLVPYADLSLLDAQLGLPLPEEFPPTDHTASGRQTPEQEDFGESS